MYNPDKEFKKATKCLKTGLFKWKADHASAAIHFENAAKAYEQQGNLEGALRAYQELSKVNEQLSDVWASARNYESITLIYLRTDRPKEAVGSAEKAVEQFRVNGSGDKALRFLTNLGSELANKQLVELASVVYAQALKLIPEEELYMQARDLVSPYAGLLLENSLYSDAMVVYEKELGFAQALQREHHVNKAAMCIVAVSLLSVPSQAQRKCEELCASVPSFITSTEYQVISDLLDAYSNASQEDFEKAARRGVWNNLEPQLTRLVRNLKLPSQAQQVEQELDFT